MGSPQVKAREFRIPDCTRRSSGRGGAHAKAGTKPPKETQTLELPAELVAVLDANPTLAEAFHALTPGRQKSHALAIGAAKASATRAARVTKLAPLILAGKGALDR